MTETVLRRQLRGIEWEGGTLRDQANYENMRRIIIKQEDEIRALRRKVPKFHYPDPTYRLGGLRVVGGSDDGKTMERMP